ncbi:MAG TPA: hypothetical protein VKE51_04515 [Vicinamibacterales bacterium]|nr:hypothetical protein [Vicinamibacterales bacterium]
MSRRILATARAGPLACAFDLIAVDAQRPAMDREAMPFMPK